MLGRRRVTPGWADDTVRNVESGQNKTAGEKGHMMSGGEGGEGSISVCNNKRQRIGT